MNWVKATPLALPCLLLFTCPLHRRAGVTLGRSRTAGYFTRGLMAHSRLQLGVLAPLKDIDVVDSTIQAITLFEGFNTIGRSDLLAASKQVSRKHVSIHASNGLFQVTVEGQNPIVLRTGTERIELRPEEKAFIHAGDIVEFLPGKYAFKLMADIHEKSDTEMVKEEKKLLVKRKRQEMEDESLARALQAIEDKTAQTSYNEHVSDAKVDCLTTAERKIQNNFVSCPKNNSSFQGVTEGYNPRTFQLLKVRGLPDWANAGCVGIQDVIEGDVLFAMLSNYMVDLEWLLSACPLLNRVPRVVVVHGESGSSLESLKAGKPSQWLLHKPPLPLSYGTHHSKAMILIYQTGVRVIVHTANLIYVDWNNKTQGLWMQDFPYKKEEDKGARSPFEDDLIEYLEALQWNGCTAKLPNHDNTKINASFFRKFDYSSAKVRLIASVPGYHQGHKLRKWGHMKLRSVLEQHHFKEDFVKSPLVYQFSSLGSLDEKWIEEFSTSTSAGYTFQRKALGIGSFQILWPTVEDVRCSIEGYGAGNAIPSPLKNVEKEFLKNYWARWQADHTGRSQAMPHFKSYIRYNDQDLAWILLTSANLSKAAWGALQKNGSQLMIRSYELGVLFLPFEQNPGSSFSCTGGKIRNEHYIEKKSTEAVRFATTCYKSDNDKEQTSNILRFPIPYRLPLKRYDSEDIPWSWDRQYFKPDTYGELWPRVVKLYGTKDN